MTQTLYRDELGRFASKSNAVRVQKRAKSGKGKKKKSSKKQNNELTKLILIVDRSGSMGSIQDEAENGVNAFIKEQKEAEGKAVLTICQFDTVIDYLYKSSPIDTVGTYCLVPRGLTALNDAICETLTAARAEVTSASKKDRPGLVSVLIVTDGHENASRRHSKFKADSIIEKCKKDDWQIQFVGTQHNARNVARSYGITTSAMLGKGKMDDAYQMLSGKIAQSRSFLRDTGEIKEVDFDAGEIKMLAEDD